MHGFLVPHPLAPTATGIPCRCSLASVASVLNPDGTVTVEELSIMADAMEANYVGANMDPCIFSDPLPWCWSYCRLTSRGKAARNLMLDASEGRHTPTQRLLRHEICPGDIVFFGNIARRRGEFRCLWIDTVFVVETRDKWQIAGTKRNDVWSLVCPPRRERMTDASDAWRFHFSDHLASHVRFIGDPPYYTFFARMYEAAAQKDTPFSFVPWVADNSLLQVDADALAALGVAWAPDLFTQAQDAFSKLRSRPVGLHPTRFDGERALALWSSIKRASTKCVVAARPTEDVQDGAMFRQWATRTRASGPAERG